MANLLLEVMRDRMMVDRGLVENVYLPWLMSVIDTLSGKPVTSIAIDSDVDDVFYDKTSQQIYISCGGRSIDIIRQTNANSYTANRNVSSYSGARTSLFLAEQNLLIIASPSSLKRNASLLIYNTK